MDLNRFIVGCTELLRSKVVVLNELYVVRKIKKYKIVGNDVFSFINCHIRLTITLVSFPRISVSIINL